MAAKKKRSATPAERSVSEGAPGYFVHRSYGGPVREVGRSRKRSWTVHKGRWKEPDPRKEAPGRDAGSSRRELGIFVSLEELERMVATALAEQRAQMLDASTAGLTADEAAVLESGAFPLELAGAGEDPLALGIAEFAALLETARSVRETAELAGVDPSRIRQRLGARPATLIGVRVAGGWRIPLFQFTGDRGGLLPGLETVIPAVDPEAHPLAVQRWFLAPHPDLAVEREVEGEDEQAARLSPRDWLRHGLPPETVAELAREL